MSEFQKDLRQAADHLAHNDTTLAPIIKQAGLPTFVPNADYYQALVDAIISQQLSVKAAASIEKRFCALFGEADFPLPQKILEKSIEDLRSAGLSRAKANYVRDLALHVVQGDLHFTNFSAMPNEQILADLVAVKGIGEWTAHMFLIFCMARLDVLPIGDLGIKNGIKKLYGLDHTPTAAEVADHAQKYHWHPYESVASWYIWQSLDNAPSS